MYIYCLTGSHRKLNTKEVAIDDSESIHKGRANETI